MLLGAGLCFILALGGPDLPSKLIGTTSEEPTLPHRAGAEKLRLLRFVVILTLIATSPTGMDKNALSHLSTGQKKI